MEIYIFFTIPISTTPKTNGSKTKQNFITKLMKIGFQSQTNKTPNHMKNKTSFIIRLLMSVILFQSLYFKFGGHDQAVYIFSTLGVEPWGRYLLGTIELVFAVALLVPKTKHIAAVLTGNHDGSHSIPLVNAVRNCNPLE